MAGLIKTPDEVKKIRLAGRILAKVLNELSLAAEEGVTLKDLDGLAFGLIKKAGAKPAFFGYRPSGAGKPFPATLCASLNDVVVHGIPSKRRLKSGDLLKLDLGVLLDDYYADAAITIGIGKISPVGERLIAAAKGALESAIEAVKPGNTLGDIGNAVHRFVGRHGFKAVKGLTGHGIGSNLHEEPDVLNYGEPGRGRVLKTGMVLAIEPMISAGSELVKRLSDDSYATVDGSLSSHFEHTVAVAEKGMEVLTML